MSSSFTVVYDASVLYPAPLRDFLLWLALTDLFRARWTNRIQEEWMRNLVKNRPDLDLARLERTRTHMNQNIRGCLVFGFEHLIPTIDLPDADDRHVVAAAAHCGASLIVTMNLKDFPERALRPFNMAAQHPDDFALDLLDLDAEAVIDAVRQHRQTLVSPPKSVDDHLATLEKQGLVRTTQALRGRKSEI